MKVQPRPSKILRPVIWVLAIAYFLVDALFISLLKPLERWLERVASLRRITAWIRSLGPYSSLFLFIVPLVVLEPVKPTALYLMGIGQWYAGLLVLVVGEALKILVLERLFHLTRPKLMSFRVFAWAYDWLIQIFAYLRSFEVWKSARRWFEEIRAFARRAAWNPRLVLRRQQIRPIRR